MVNLLERSSSRRRSKSGGEIIQRDVELAPSSTAATSSLSKFDKNVRATLFLLYCFFSCSQFFSLKLKIPETLINGYKMRSIHIDMGYSMQKNTSILKGQKTHSVCRTLLFLFYNYI